MHRKVSFTASPPRLRPSNDEKISWFSGLIKVQQLHRNLLFCLFTVTYLRSLARHQQFPCQCPHKARLRKAPLDDLTSPSVCSPFIGPCVHLLILPLSGPLLQPGRGTIKQSLQVAAPPSDQQSPSNFLPWKPSRAAAHIQRPLSLSLSCRKPELPCVDSGHTGFFFSFFALSFFKQMTTVRRLLLI